MPVPFPRARSVPPYVDTQRIKRLDYWAAHEYQMTLPLMLEHAGRLFADFARLRYSLKPGGRVLVLAGSAGNGAGALAAGRHLVHRGLEVEALLADPSTKLKADTKRLLAMFRKEGGSVPTDEPSVSLPQAEVVLDGLIGYGLRGSPRGRTRTLIELANAAKLRRVALDLPSGLHPDTGVPADPTFRADATLALGFPKQGVREAAAKPYVGELYLADISMPRDLYDEFDTTPEAIFGDASIVRLL